MVYEGLVKNGVVVFASSAPPDGTVVRVQPVVPDWPRPDPTPADVEAMWDGLMKLAGKAQGLPPDLAERHDH